MLNQESILKINVAKMSDRNYYTNAAMHYMITAFIEATQRLIQITLEEKHEDVTNFYSSKSFYDIVHLESSSGLLPVDVILFDIFKSFPILSELFNENADLLNIISCIAREIKSKNIEQVQTYKSDKIPTRTAEDLVQFYSETVDESENPTLNRIYAKIIALIYNTGHLNYDYADYNFSLFTDLFDTEQDRELTEETFVCSPRKLDMSNNGNLDMAFSKIVNSNDHLWNIIKHFR